MKLDDIRQRYEEAYNWAINQNYPSVAAQYAKTLAQVVDELSTEVERMAEEMQNAEIHADCMEARAIAYEAEVKRWVDKHNQAALNFQQERDKGCIYCTERGYWVNTQYNEVDVMAGEEERLPLKLNFCFNCGRRLEVEQCAGRRERK